MPVAALPASTAPCTAPLAAAMTVCIISVALVIKPGEERFLLD